MNKIDLEKLVGDSKFLREVGQGSYGEVYRIGENIVGKFFYKYPGINLPIYRSTLFDAENESKIGKFAYENGVSVPKPEGVFLVEHPLKKEFYPAFVMEYIEGISGDKLNLSNGYSPEKIKHIFDLAWKEKLKLSNLNVFFYDDVPRNIIWSEKKQKVYLIDFGCWFLEEKKFLMNFSLEGTEDSSLGWREGESFIGF